ncbi:hypothetical protein F2P79_025057 [Pimephales promelas]|nr:hypothetical protein F2P79_025057 [Pimephales promelas]
MIYEVHGERERGERETEEETASKGNAVDFLLRPEIREVGQKGSPGERLLGGSSVSLAPPPTPRDSCAPLICALRQPGPRPPRLQTEWRVLVSPPPRHIPVRLLKPTASNSTHTDTPTNKAFDLDFSNHSQSTFFSHNAPVYAS